MDRKSLIKRVLLHDNIRMFIWIRSYLIRNVDLNFGNDRYLTCFDVSTYLDEILSECMIDLWEILPIRMKTRNVGILRYSEIEWPEYYKEHKVHKALFGKKSSPDCFSEIVLEILEESEIMEMNSYEITKCGMDILLDLIKRKLFFFIYT